MGLKIGERAGAGAGPGHKITGKSDKYVLVAVNSRNLENNMKTFVWSGLDSSLSSVWLKFIARTSLQIANSLNLIYPCLIRSYVYAKFKSRCK